MLPHTSADLCVWLCAMGNFSSCANGAFSVWHTDEAGNAGAAAAAPIAQALVKVLLVDGGVLHFEHPIKVIRVLLDYPHHFICPLDSLKPGHHSLSSLLPDEELQVGHLYLLLPFAHHTSSLVSLSSSSSSFPNYGDAPSQFPPTQSPIISSAGSFGNYGDGSLQFPARESPIVAPAPSSRKSGHGSSHFHAEESPIIASPEIFRKYGDGSFRKERPAISSAESSQSYRDGSLLFPAKESLIVSSAHSLEDNDDGVLLIPAQTSQNCDDGSALNPAKESPILGDRTRLLARNMSEINSSSSSSASFRKGQWKGAKPHVGYCITKSSSSFSHLSEERARPVSNMSRLCDTPELQRAYRSAMLRRCRSWTPRLQAINEGNGSRRTNAA